MHSFGRKAKACTRSRLPRACRIIEPGHFRFTANGETVVRLEERLGYTHKGIESLMTGASVDAAARLAARTSGDSTAAYGFAFARAVEVALGIEIPPRAIWLRALMAELERLANHFGDIGAICNDAGFAIMLAHCGILRERVLRTAQACFGHRLMMDCIVPAVLAVIFFRLATSKSESWYGRSAKRFRRWSNFTTTRPRSRTAPLEPDWQGPRSSSNTDAAALSPGVGARL